MEVIIIRTLLYGIKRKPFINIIFIIIITFVMTFVSIIYSSLKYNTDVSKLINGGYDPEHTVEYLVGEKGDSRNISKDAFKNIAKNCDMEMEFVNKANVDEVIIRVVYSKNNPKLLVFNERKIETGDFNKIYPGYAIADKFKNTLEFADKSYEIGQPLGIETIESQLDDTALMYVSNPEDLIYFITTCESTNNLRLYVNNKDYSTYDRDIRSAFNEGDFYIKNITGKNQSWVKLKNNYGYEYLALIILGIISIIMISTFWIKDKKKNIAIKRAFGAKNKHLILEIYKELSILWFSCGIVGFVISFIISKASNNIDAILVSVDIKDFIIFFIYTVIISIAVSSIPIYIATHRSIIVDMKGR